MAVDLADLVDSLRREISPLSGTNPYEDTSDDTLAGYLADAFWEGRLNGLFTGYTINEDDELVPISGTDDMPRYEQQAIVLWAGYRAVLNDLRNVQSLFRAKAGPVEYETQQSATLLKAILDALQQKIDRVISDIGGTSAAVFDAVIERSYSMGYGDTWWVR